MPEWSFGDEPDLDLPFQPGQAHCHYCGTPADNDIPAPNQRCETCHRHLHTCRNCMFDHGMGCLVLSPYRWGKVGVPGQDCPYFTWRDDDRAPTLDADQVANLRRRIAREADAEGDENQSDNAYPS